MNLSFDDFDDPWIVCDEDECTNPISWRAQGKTRIELLNKTVKEGHFCDDCLSKISSTYTPFILDIRLKIVFHWKLPLYTSFWWIFPRSLFCLILEYHGDIGYQQMDNISPKTMCELRENLILAENANVVSANHPLTPLTPWKRPEEFHRDLRNYPQLHDVWGGCRYVTNWFEEPALFPPMDLFLLGMTKKKKLLRDDVSNTTQKITKCSV